MFDTTAARGLGWASIGIGLTEIAAPEQLERLMGIGNGQHTGVLRVLGVRELMHGVDILSNRDPTPGVEARVAGDALDLALLAAVARQTRRSNGLAMAIGMVLGIAAADVLLARRLEHESSEQ